MSQRNPSSPRIPTCPDCGRKLVGDDLLHCEQHGTFFRYGPRLIVRCATKSYEQPVLNLMPWQTLLTC